MHDLHAADKILKLALEEAEKNQLRNIKKINIELGRVVEHGSEIVPENLKFNVQMLSKGTIAEGSEVIVNTIQAENYWALKDIEGDRE